MVAYISWIALEAGSPWWVISLVFASGLWISVRGYRMAVIFSDSSITIRGQLHTRVIPKAQITAIHTRVDGFPAVLWRRPGGRKRWSPMLAFSGNSRELSYFHDRKMLRLEQIRIWYRRNRSKN